jgi:hypothetical protein
MALIIGFALVAAMGGVHHAGLLAIERLAPSPRIRPNLSLLATFLGLLTLHTAEILAYAGAYALLLEVPGMGALGGDFGGTWGDYVHFSGISFSTLGLSGIEAQGPIRLVGMMQSLGGFMVLTWSATFIYSMWEQIRD